MSWFLFGVHNILFSVVSVCGTASSVELLHRSFVLSGPVILDSAGLHQCCDRWHKNQSVRCPSPWENPELWMYNLLFLCPQKEPPELYHSLFLEPEGFWSISKLSCSLVLSSLQAVRICLSQAASKTNETETSSLSTCRKSWNIGRLFQFFASPGRIWELEVFWSSFHTDPGVGNVMSGDVFQTFTFVFSNPWSGTLSCQHLDSDKMHVSPSGSLLRSQNIAHLLQSLPSHGDGPCLVPQIFLLVSVWLVSHSSGVQELLQCFLKCSQRELPILLLNWYLCREKEDLGLPRWPSGCFELESYPKSPVLWIFKGWDYVSLISVFYGRYTVSAY